MRKMIWSAAAVALMATAGLYWAVDYAAKHPQSWIGRVVESTSCIGAKCSPVVAIRGFHRQPTDVAVDDRQPEKKVQMIVQRPQPQVVEPIVVEFPQPPIEEFLNALKHVEDSEERRVHCEAANETPMFMPYAKEDQRKCTEQEQCAARDGCRAVCKGEQTSWLWQGFVRFASFFQPTAETTNLKPAVYEVETNYGPQNSAKIREADAPTPQENPHYYHRHTGCPYFGGYRCHQTITPQPMPKAEDDSR